jgi:hypothetical protein
MAARILSIGKEDLKTLVACTDKLNRLGFTTQFQARDNGLISLVSENIYFPDEVEIVDFYRFEGESDPDDSAILYAIQTHTGEQGTLTDAYGMYNDTKVSEFIKQVNSIRKKVQGNS